MYKPYIYLFKVASLKFHKSNDITRYSLLYVKVRLWWKKAHLDWSFLPVDTVNYQYKSHSEKNKQFLSFKMKQIWVIKPIQKLAHNLRGFFRILSIVQNYWHFLTILASYNDLVPSKFFDPFKNKSKYILSKHRCILQNIEQVLRYLIQFPNGISKNRSLCREEEC